MDDSYTNIPEDDSYITLGSEPTEKNFNETPIQDSAFPKFTRYSYSFCESANEIRQDNSLCIFSSNTDIYNKLIHLGDVFKNIKVIHSVRIDNNLNRVIVEEITFPFVICLNQECDLLTDFINHNMNDNKDSSFFQLIILPAFSYESFVIGNHWNNLRQQSVSRISKKKMNNITVQNSTLEQNNDPRYHFLFMPIEADLPHLVIDFKHFFTINRDYLYSQYSQKAYSLPSLVKERISQRFCNYFCRIGLPNPEDQERLDNSINK